MTHSACGRCLLSDAVPGVSIAEEGVCSVCKEYDALWGNWAESKKIRAKELEAILEAARGKKGLYDVLVPLSGGKDSIYVLYLCRRVFDLRCLAVTWDNGFLSEHARENIRNACAELRVDHTYYGMNRDLLMKLYRHSFLKTGFFCPVCLQGMGVAIERTQAGFEIPLAVKGTARRTEEHVAPEYFVEGGISFIENLLKGSEWEKEAAAMLQPAGIFSSPRAIQLPNFMDWNYDTIYKTIKTELGWKAHSVDAEHTDCKVDNIVNWIRYKKYNVLVPEMLRFSKLVTAGQMSRDEALRRVAESEKALKEPENLDYFLNSLGVSREEMEEVLADKRRHFKYLKQNNRVIRRLRNLKRRFLK
jgi:hypothetical protein